MSITEKSLIDFSTDAIKNYIFETVSNRSVPAYQDGLKPVQRRILWAMYKMGMHYNLSHRKSAKVTGEVIAKYHPHGDSSVYQAMVNMAQAYQKYNFIDGQGNWGAWSGEDAASQRYTECRLSELAQTCLLDSDYLNVVPFVSNYDGTEQEPAYLPSRLPFILLLNVQGIATAVRTGLPSFDLKSVVQVCIDFITKRKFDRNKIIPITSIYGGRCVSSNDDLLEFYQKGEGSITFEPTYTIVPGKIEITGIQDNFDYLRISECLMEMDEVKAVKDEGSSEIRIGIYFDKKLDQKGISKIISKLQTRILYSTNILRNVVTDQGEIHGKYYETNIYSLIKNWCGFRIALEERYLKHLMRSVNNDLRYQRTLLIASTNTKVIFEGLQTEDPERYLIDKLGCTSEQASLILELPVKRLSKLSEQKTRQKIQALVDQNNSLAEKLKDCEHEVVSDLENLCKKFG